MEDIWLIDQFVENIENARRRVYRDPSGKKTVVSNPIRSYKPRFPGDQRDKRREPQGMRAGYTKIDPYTVEIFFASKPGGVFLSYSELENCTLALVDSNEGTKKDAMLAAQFIQICLYHFIGTISRIDTDNIPDREWSYF